MRHFMSDLQRSAVVDKFPLLRTELLTTPHFEGQSQKVTNILHTVIYSTFGRRRQPKLLTGFKFKPRTISLSMVVTNAFLTTTYVS